MAAQATKPDSLDLKMNSAYGGEIKALKKLTFARLHWYFISVSLYNNNITHICTYHFDIDMHMNDIHYDNFHWT